MAANANRNSDTIVLPAGTFTLTIPGRDENNDATGDLDISSNLTITRKGAGKTIIDGNNAMAASGAQGGAGGTATALGAGGAILSENDGADGMNGSPSTDMGGGVALGGTVTDTNTTITGNHAGTSENDVSSNLFIFFSFPQS